ncbi:unnamed protein product [Nyctereutes procyonoides]|uniref:(raccoon dog) hypothetical protein n=1 Tax=Nyctereutes procyonoides TaxID=34880 RepID=A0A811YMC1_NYCPR|nr:unnamed protein product [Nyctereutes procyonoides]
MLSSNSYLASSLPFLMILYMGCSVASTLWSCDLKKWTWTFKPQKEGKQDSELLFKEMNLIGILPLSSPEDKKIKPITMAPLQASVLSLLVSFQLQTGSGPEKEEKDDVIVDVFLEEVAPVQQKKKMEKKKNNSPMKKVKPTLRPKKPGSKK